MLYNPLDNFYKSVVGAVRENSELTLRVKGDFSFVNLVYCNDNEITEKKVALHSESDFFACNITLPCGLYWYWFETDKGYITLGKDYTGILVGDLNDVKYFQLSVYDKSFNTPEWLKGGVIYQIFPDRFNVRNKNKSVGRDKILHSDLSDTPIFKPNDEGEVLNNDFFGGDIGGITDKLSYLKSLGVTAIYLNPVCEAYSNHRYDTGDYMKIDSLLGTEKDLIELIQNADKEGIKIILDGVFNHTGSDSKYFNKKGNYSEVGAYQSKDSAYYKWYKFIEYPEKYESWWGITTLPATDKNSKEFIDYITGEKGVLSYYLSLGVYGVRLDVVDELPAHFVKEIRSRVKTQNPDAVIIGEVWEDASNKISYGQRREYFLGKELDSVMNYPLKNAIIDFIKTGNETSLIRTVREQLDHYPSSVLPLLMNILSTHDTYRLISALSDIDASNMTKEEMSKCSLNEFEREKAVERVKKASLLLYTLYGAVSIYYGDEIGMEGFSDPLNRKFFEWDKVGNEINEWYIKLGALRKKYSALGKGTFTEIYAKNGAMVFKMSDEYSEVLIAVNEGERKLIINSSEKLKDVISNIKTDEKIVLEKGAFGVYVKEV